MKVALKKVHKILLKNHRKKRKRPRCRQQVQKVDLECLKREKLVQECMRSSIMRDKKLKLKNGLVNSKLKKKKKIKMLGLALILAAVSFFQLQPV